MTREQKHTLYESLVDLRAHCLYGLISLTDKELKSKRLLFFSFVTQNNFKTPETRQWAVVFV